MSTRREFLGGAALAAGTLAAGTLLKLSLEPPSALALSLQTPQLGHGHIDDAWGHWPPYAHPIPHAAPAASVDWTHVDPIDRMYVM